MVASNQWTSDFAEDGAIPRDPLARHMAIARRAYRFDVPDDEGFDPHIVLGLQRNATNADIRAAYLTLAKELHPDRRANDPEAEKRFKALTYAYHALVLAKKQEASSGRRRHLRILVALSAFLAPVACVGIYVLVSQPESGASFAERHLVIDDHQDAFKAGAPAMQQADEITTSSLRPTDNAQTALVAPLEDDIKTIAQQDDSSRSIERHTLIFPQDLPELPPTDEGSAFLSSLTEQQDMLVVYNYLKFDAMSQDAGYVREHLRSLILGTRDRSQLAALLLALGQEDHVEAALATGRIKKLNDEETNAYESMRWVAAMRKKTKAAFEGYQRRYAQGRYASLARKRIQALLRPQLKPVEDLAALRITKENEAWKKAREQNTKAAYSAYKAAYPKGRYVQQVNRKLALLEPVVVSAPSIAPPPKLRAPERLPKAESYWPSPDEPLVHERFR